MQGHLFTDLSQFLTIHPYFGIGFTFIVAFLESLAIIGSIVPGSVTLTAIGVLIGTGILASIPTLSSAILGAFAGDSISFFIGKKYQHKLQDKWPFTAYPNLLPKGEAFLNQHGNLSIFIGRFVGPIRCILPISAGILNMNTTRFIIADFISAIFWAPSYLLPGILIGATSLELEPNTGPRLIIASLVILCLVWLIKLGGNYFASIFQRQLLRFSMKLSRYYPSTYAHFYRDHTIRCRSILMFASFASFIVLLLLLKSPFVLTLNYSVWHLMQSFRFLQLSSLFTAYSLFADKYVIILTSISLGLFWLQQKERTLAFAWFATILMTFLTTWYDKHMLAMPRPTGLIYTRETYSFPSGHSTLISMLLSYVYFSLVPHLKRRHAKPLLKIFIVLISIQLLGRLYLGAHWLSDVLGGALLGCCIATFFSAYYIPKQINSKLAKRSLIFLAAIWISVTIFYSVLNFKEQYQRYRIKPLPIQAVYFDRWWQQSVLNLPTTQLNYIGEADVPFNLQWNDSEQHLIKVLQTQGWKRLSSYGWVSFADRLAHFGSLFHLPLFPKLFHFKPAALIFIKQVKPHGPIVMIHLWQAPLILRDRSPQQIYIGTVHYRYIWHKQAAKQTYQPIATILEPILQQYQWQKQYTPSKIKPSLEIDDPNHIYLLTHV